MDIFVRKSSFFANEFFGSASNKVNIFEADF